METSAPKRRKTSPTESVPVESTTPSDPLPVTQPQPSQPSPSRSPSRPSFASPTRSSLARHNPEILSRRREPPSSRSEDLPASRPTSPDRDADADVGQDTRAQQQREDDGRASSSPPISSGPSGRALAADNAPPRRTTPPRPYARPLRPPVPETEEEDIVAPFAGRESHRSQLLTNTGVLPVVVREEPELPPTPQRPDPVVSTPPSGIHNTPSKRRRDPSERLAAQPSSPSKQRSLSQDVAPDVPPQKESQKVVRREGRGAGRFEGTVADASRPLQEIEEGEVEAAKPKSEFVPGTHPRRSVRLRGPDWAKREERDRLKKEIEQLEADLELARSENDNAAQGLGLIANEDTILDLLRRHLVPVEEIDQPAANAQWLEKTMNPIAMLGFNGLKSLHPPPPIITQETKDKTESPPVSHHPIPMTASEELPYLQVFTPLAFTSTINTISPPSDQPDQPTLQKHMINVRSATPPGLFMASIEMTVNTRTLAVSSLSVPRLDPAAAAELQPFLDSTTSSQAPYHPALTRNISLVCWAMGEWYRVALRRAKFWHALEKQLGPDAGKAGLVEVVLATRAQRKRAKRSRQRDQAGDVESEAGAGDSFASVESLGGLDSMLFSKAEVMAHMSRTSMDLSIPRLLSDGIAATSDLRVKWSMDFDWTGEARSKIGVDVSMPGKWQATDERKSLVGIPKVFDKLIKGGEDPLMAVKTMVALLAGEPVA